jgi:hypothetical protein
MNANELAQRLFETVTQHVPPGAHWVAPAALATLTLIGIVMMVRGAKLAPAFAALAFLGLGGVGGSFLADWVALPVWPTMGVIGVVGLIIGLTLFRFWQAALLAVCCAGGALSVYYVQVLQPHAASFVYGNPGALVTVPEPGANLAESATASASQVLSQLWSHLSANVSSFQTNFMLILSSAAIAGLVFGWLLPRASRALWGASLGTVFFLAGLMALLQMFAPTAAAWLTSRGPWSWALLAAVWGGSLIYNLVTCREKKSEKDSGKAAKPAAA